MNKFEQVSSLGHQMSLAVRELIQGGGGRGLVTKGPVRGAGPCTGKSNTSWIMVTWNSQWAE